MDVEVDTPALSEASSSSSNDPEFPVQPAFFYPSGSGAVRLDDNPGYLSPDQDPLATRGIPVFKPSMDEFSDFEKYMERVEVWGRKSGIVKIIPPKEWSDSLPSTSALLPDCKLRNPIEQHMLGRGGLFRQSNVEKRRVFNVREWAEMCTKDELKAPTIKDGSVKTRGIARAPPKPRKRGKVTAVVPETIGDGERGNNLAIAPHLPEDQEHHLVDLANDRPTALASSKESKDAAFFSTFEPRSSWLPEDTTAEDYTPEACKELERLFWRTCGLGAPALYGADMAGSLFTEETETWNVAKLPSFLSRLCLNKALPGVNTPYLYFGMWRATFAWHVEDMDLYSINFIHWGAPKYWYAIPSERSKAFEGVMQGYFPGDINSCPQFLRHKSYLASPTLLSQSSCRPNTVVQHQGEFVITYPRGYHAGFNLGLNCAESVNFALESWIDLGRKAGVCNCVGDSVRIDVDTLLQELNNERDMHDDPHALHKRKFDEEDSPLDFQTFKKPKRSPSIISTAVPTASHPIPQSNSEHRPRIRIPPAPQTPCCLCASNQMPGLLPVYDPPSSWSGAKPAAKCDESGNEVGGWLAHEHCARAIPETWVDMVDGRRMVFGVDGIVKDRWNLKCSACTRPILKAYGAKVQCTKGKCPKSYHVTCAMESEDIVFKELDEVEKEIVLVETPLTMEEPYSTSGSSTTTADISHGGDVSTLQPHHQPATQECVKTIRKPTIELLCPQHNPVLLAQKKAQKLDQLRKDVLALAPPARIRIRNAAGVYEVTLLRVEEERSSVLVDWSNGESKEFKWSSIVWGQVPEGTVTRKAESEMGPAKTSRVPVHVPISQALIAPNPPATGTAHITTKRQSHPGLITSQPSGSGSTTSATPQPLAVPLPRLNPATQSYAPMYTYPYAFQPAPGYGWMYPPHLPAAGQSVLQQPARGNAGAANFQNPMLQPSWYYYPRPYAAPGAVPGPLPQSGSGIGLGGPSHAVASPWYSYYPTNPNSFHQVGSVAPSIPAPQTHPPNSSSQGTAP